MKVLMELRAAAGGYFSLPCPTCGETFYGFQHKQCGSIPTADPGIFKMICPRCSKRLGIGPLGVRRADNSSSQSGVAS